MFFQSEDITAALKARNILLRNKFELEERDAQKREQEKKTKKEEAKRIHKQQQQQ